MKNFLEKPFQKLSNKALQMISISTMINLLSDYTKYLISLNYLDLSKNKISVDNTIKNYLAERSNSESGGN